MPPHLSQQLRERIVYWRHELHKPIEEVVELARCSERTVYEVLRLHRLHGTVTNPFAQQRARPRVLTVEDKNFLASLLAANPALYLDELQSQLYERRGVDTCLATISRAIRQLNITHKSISPEALERNELLRAIWQGAHAHIPKESFIWLDEASVDDQTNHRNMGWAALGRACVCRTAFMRGQRFSVLPALTCDGIIAMDIFEGSVTKERFLGFIEKQIVCSYH